MTESTVFTTTFGIWAKPFGSLRQAQVRSLRASKKTPISGVFS
ncbi:MAG: hypothetical protein AAB877_00800 [Patescibacteria group bacterium]